MPKKFDAIFQQRDNRNTKFREVTISGSNLIIQTDGNGNLIGKTLSNTFTSASNYYIQNKLNVGTIFVRNSITSSVYRANTGAGQVGFIGTSSFALTASAVISASHADIADRANTFRGRDINAFAMTGSNSFFGNQAITGSISFTGILSGSSISASKLFVKTGSIYKFYSQKARTDKLSGSGYNFSFGYTDLSNVYKFTAVTASFHTLRLTTGSAPMFNDHGNAGEIRIDGDFVYLYAGEAWRRIPANRWFV